MAKGDHISVKRRGYWHHGIDAGGGWVYHLSGEPGRKRNASVRCDRRPTFADGGSIEVVSYDACDPVEVVLDRARSKLEERDYNLFVNNCEHFARWCKTGKKASAQVQDAGKALGMAGDITGNEKLQGAGDALQGAGEDAENRRGQIKNVGRRVIAGRIMRVLKRFIPPLP